ncbi:hypothetical protein Q8A73_013531 [Channa argus]|nr:hypothetical protein Q8A73_013531 [Channa argus]
MALPLLGLTFDLIGCLDMSKITFIWNGGTCIKNLDMAERDYHGHNVFKPEHGVDHMLEVTVRLFHCERESSSHISTNEDVVLKSIRSSKLSADMMERGKPPNSKLQAFIYLWPITSEVALWDPSLLNWVISVNNDSVFLFVQIFPA